MIIRKLGLLYQITSNQDWHVSHAMVPTPLLLDDRIRVFYSTRSHLGKSHIAYVDLDRNNPKKVLDVSKTPVLMPGTIGTFDDCGVTADSIVDLGDKIYMYYIGWNQMVTTPYRNTIGLAISYDRGASFERYSLAPIMERTKEEPYFCTSPWVLKENDEWHMWYACITSWIHVNNKPEPLYHIKYASSRNGIDWQRDNISCIQPLYEDEANVRPTVIKVNGMYKMWYCFRGSCDFRDGKDSYKIGYAESVDGKNWNRKDDSFALTGDEHEWDGKMQAYPAVIKVGCDDYIFYNGNGFGKEGFGCAILEKQG